MKLIRFADDQSGPSFGVVIRDHAVAFSALAAASGRTDPSLRDSRSYLANLPDSEQVAKELLAWGEEHLDQLDPSGRPPLADIRLLPPVEVAALFDFGLTPRHLKNSATTLFVHEKDDPDTAPILAAFSKAVAAPEPAPEPGRPKRLSFYKANMNSIAGDGANVPWPAYTSRLDIEPELAVVYGNAHQPVAGYCIFNDVSARDVQVPEMVGGFCLTKDMAQGNQLGPYLVTVDEVGDPFDLAVSVRVNGHLRFEGSTSEIVGGAEEVFAWLEVMAPVAPGSVMGFGTIPDCTGLDHGDFLNPGAQIEIEFERLGTLTCTFEQPQALLRSRWPVRPSLLRYHERGGDPSPSTGRFPMSLEQVSDHCYAVINAKNRVCDANSGYVDLGDGLLFDTQSDLPHAHQMIDLFSSVWARMPRYVVNSHEDIDHVGGNQLFPGAQIIGHRSLPERMREVADPKEMLQLLFATSTPQLRTFIQAGHRGMAAMGRQLLEDYDFRLMELATPTALVDDTLVLHLDDTEVHVIYVGPCHNIGDVIVHVPSEGVVFAGDVVFQQCTPIAWAGRYDDSFRILDLIAGLQPEVVVPGHGPVCGLDGLEEMRAYLKHVREESAQAFARGLTSLEAAKQIDLGQWAAWRAPGRVYMNVERAYRELRGDEADLPWDRAATFDAIYEVARAKGLPVEF